MQRVFEKATPAIEFSCFDIDGSKVTPTSVSFKVIDAETAVVIRSGSVSPAKTMTLQTTTADNTFQDATKKKEYRRIVIEAPYGSGKQATGYFEYELFNISGVS